MWDQQAFNEMAMWPSAGGFRRPPLSVRVMDWMRFSNSKTYFAVQAQQAHRVNVVTIHLNYEGFGEKLSIMPEVDRSFSFPVPPQW